MTAPAIALLCPECGAPMELRWSKKYERPFYGCSQWRATGCDGTHGAHPDGSPLGIPADRETKAARIRAHAAFDRLWQGRMLRTRKAAYRWMREELGMSKEAAHIGRFTIAECDRLIAAVDAFEVRR